MYMSIRPLLIAVVVLCTLSVTRCDPILSDIYNSTISTQDISTDVEVVDEEGFIRTETSTLMLQVHDLHLCSIY
jgi:hypothetical protein